ncbi:hypothetical protein RJ639_047717 [Escallonia herrerae]|uniref:Glycosyltransferase n=1 Tax=Escallonia herrerae TaxID=1293975 RepID=A0AA88W3P2_9ASTE|nr:hypothetical protein RJ639_047717 [Escallonia herrerae]
MSDRTIHIVMYPWFAMGHLTAFVHIANKLAAEGHKISFFVPTKSLPKVEQFNLHPDFISFIPVTVPHVEGLPPGAETTSDVPYPLHTHIMTAMDLTRPMIESSLKKLRPHFVFFDFAYWLPSVTQSLGIKSLLCCIISPATIGYLLSPARGKQMTEADLMEPPQGFPPSSIKLHAHEARGLATQTLKEYGSGVSFVERLLNSFIACDAISFRACREMEGPYCDYLESQFKKPVILSGPVVPDPPTSTLDERWTKWLNGFKPKTVIFCALGSECSLKKNLFQELILGLELTGLPFIAALKPPIGADTVESALPEGFEERTQRKGVVYGGWIQQQFILANPSVGCFVTHCGSGSLAEGMVNECQLVLLPHVGDQIINARLMNDDLKVGVEVEKGEEDGVFSKESVCKAIRLSMDADSKVGEEVRANHARWREFFLSEGLEKSYTDGFVQKLQELLD